MKKDEIDQNKNCVIVFVQVDFSSIRKVGHSSWFSDVRRLPLWKHFSGTFLHWKNFDEHKFSRKIQVDNNGVLIFSANPLFFQSRAPPLIRESQNTHSNPRKTSTSCVPCAPHPIASGMDPFSLFQDAHGSAFTVVAFELIFLLLLDIWTGHKRQELWTKTPLLLCGTKASNSLLTTVTCSLLIFLRFLANDSWVSHSLHVHKHTPSQPLSI